MSILERLESDMVKAAKARDAERLAVIRYLRSETKNRQIELRRELKDEDVIEVLARIAKKHREAIEQFTAGGRSDLVEREQRQLGVTEEYLPARLTEKELESLLSEIVEETGAAGPRDMGLVMKAVMPRVKGRADGGSVKALVQAKLNEMAGGE